MAGLVCDLISNGVDFEDIGIMTPYRAQVREIKKALNNVIGGIDAIGFYHSIDLCYKIVKGNLMKEIKNNLSHLNEK